MPHRQGSLLQKLQRTFLPSKNAVTLKDALGDLRGGSILGDKKLTVIYDFLRDVQSLTGEMAEVGTYRGGTARMIARCVPTKLLYVFDTFEGMPQHSEEIDPASGVVRDLHRKGEFADTAFDMVKRVLDDCPNVVFRKGFFPETAKGLEGQKFAFLHLDGDLYQSTRDGLEFFYPRMVKGGVMVLDDYKWRHCPGVEQALKEFMVDKPERIIEDYENQAVIVKE